MTEMEKFRDVLWLLSTVKDCVKEINEMDCGFKVDGYCGSCVMVEGIDKVGNFFGFDVADDGMLRHLKLFDVDVMERKDEVV